MSCLKYSSLPHTDYLFTLLTMNSNNLEQIYVCTNMIFVIQDSSQLKDLWKKICHNSTGMEFQDHRYWLRTYPNCIVGKELVNWLLRNDTVSTR